jgi:hypothetical protein
MDGKDLEPLSHRRIVNDGASSALGNHGQEGEMNIDFSNSRNSVIIRYLRNPFDFITGPQADLFHEARERDLAAGAYARLSRPRASIG